MNLYFRLFYILFKALLAPGISALSESKLDFRALPTDCDMNLHITNSRYLSFMDLGRTYLMGQLKLLPHLYKRRWGPVIQATELTFLKPIMVGQKFALVTRIIYWDDKYFYMEQRFMVNQQIYALATVKGLFISKQQKIPTHEIIKLVDANIIQPPMPEFIRRWQLMLEAKKSNRLLSKPSILL